MAESMEFEFIGDDQLAHIQHLFEVAEDTKGFKHALLLGMGGSSLCPEVMRITFGVITGHPELHILDSTDPAQIRALEFSEPFRRGSLCRWHKRAPQADIKNNKSPQGESLDTHR